MTAEPTGRPLSQQGLELVDADHDGIPATTPGTDLERRRAELEPVVLDAELVDDEPRGLMRRPVVAAVHRVVVRRVVVVVKAERTATASKAVLRHATYVAGGATVLANRWWRAHTTSVHQHMIRNARAAGDWDMVEKWVDKAEQSQERRHKRRMDLLEFPLRFAKALLLTVLVGAIGLLLLGLIVAVTNDDIAQILAPLLGVFRAITWTAAAVAVAGGLLIAIGPVLLVGILWRVGKNAQAAPGWLLANRKGDDETTALVTADQIARALQNLSIPKLDKAFKAGWLPPFELPPTREGQGQFKGYRAIFGLPEGVTPTMVADKVDVLAANLNRNTMETWPADHGQEKGGKARHVNLYVADRGVMDKPTPTYPLMYDGQVDVFVGAPIGITQRGDNTTMPMVGSNFVFGGRPGQGKSNGVRVVVVGAALDPLCEIRVHVFAGNGDFDAYQPRLSRYQKGASPEHAAAATTHLEELLAEVERREYRLADLGAKKLTRAIAQQHKDMRPLLVVFSECHELFTDKESGEMAADLAIPVLKRGRKTGIMTGWDTQSSRANAIPSALIENMGVNGCFSVKTWRSNDGFLGDGSFAAGIRATALRFNVDLGTMVATGMTDELFELIRTYFIEVNDDEGWDAATGIIERAMAQLDPATAAAGIRPTLAPAAPAARDLLADVAEVLGDVTVPAADVPALLARTFPTWLPYRSLTGKGLRDLLQRDHGVKVPSTDNRWPISPKLIRDALTQRPD